MRRIGKTVQFLEFLILIGSICGPGKSLAQRVLSGAELENSCQAYADKAVQNSKEWEQLQCQRKLNESNQIFDTDRTYQYNRCIRSVGTSIASDLKYMEDELRKCRGISGGGSGGTTGGTTGGGTTGGTTGGGTTGVTTGGTPGGGTQPPPTTPGVARIVVPAESGTITGGGQYTFSKPSSPRPGARGGYVYLGDGRATATYAVQTPAAGQYDLWIRFDDDGKHAAGARAVEVYLNGAKALVWNNPSRDTGGWVNIKIGSLALRAGQNTIAFTKAQTTSAAFVLDEFALTPPGQIPQ
jgi:hypothetical protein